MHPSLGRKRSSAESGPSTPSVKRRKRDGTTIMSYDFRPSPPPIPTKPPSLSRLYRNSIATPSGNKDSASPSLQSSSPINAGQSTENGEKRASSAETEPHIQQSTVLNQDRDRDSDAIDGQTQLLKSTPSSSNTSAIHVDERRIINLDASSLSDGSQDSSRTESLSAWIESCVALPNASKDGRNVVSPVELLRYAQVGVSADNFTHQHVCEMKKAADFFLGAQSFEDAFVIYLMVYKCLKSFHDTSASTLLSVIVDIARSSANRGQDEIARHLLSESLQCDEMVADEDAPGKFLLHSSMTLICRKQGDLAIANYHCQQALQCFDLRAHSLHTLSETWRRFAVLAYKHLDMMLEGGHQLLVAEEFSTRVLCRDANVELSKQAGISRSALRLMLEWCMMALKVVPAYGSWKNLDSKGQGVLSIEITALYCHFWWQWRYQETCPNTSKWSPSELASALLEHLGIVPLECLATISVMIHRAWSPLLDLRQIPDKTRMTWECHLRRCAVDGLGRLLKLSDSDIARSFLSAYSAQHFAGRDETASNSPYNELRRDYIRAYSSRSIELELPNLEIDENSLLAEEPYVSCALSPRPYLGPTLNPSLNSSSTGLASMKSLQERIRNDLTYAVDSAKNRMSVPSFSSLLGSDLDFDHVMGIAQRSFESLSVASDNVQHVVENWETRLGISQSRSLVDTRG
jgi:hypothetical protein